MATWDGSYQGGSHEDPNNYFVHPQTTQTHYYNHNPTPFPQTNGYPPFFENTRQPPERSQNPSNSLVSQSTLHAGADEFVPSGPAPEPSKIFFPDNRNRNRSKRNNQYPRQQDDYPRSYNRVEKNRRQNSTFYSNTDYQDQNYQNYPSNPEDELTNNSQGKEPPRGAYNSRRPRSHGRFTSDRYQQFNQQFNQQFPQPDQPTRGPAENDNQKTSKARQKYKEYSEDPRDESYRRPQGNDTDDTSAPRAARRRHKNDYYEDKPSSRKDKRKNYQEFNGYRSYPEKKEERKNPEGEDKNWRKSHVSSVKRNAKRSELDDAKSQKERLTDQLNRGQLECLVCCDYIRQNDGIWACSNCYHVLHLKCIKKWAESSQSESGWRCPACQNMNLISPVDYYCFCGKTRDPEWNRRDVAHSCGEVCGRVRAKNGCVHKCTLLCHPGSCPSCTATVTRCCGCGRTSQSLKCSSDVLVTCEEICGKFLNCGVHQCERKCHHEPCGDCQRKVHQVCYCGKVKREVECVKGTPGVFCCEESCGKMLECGNHQCKEKCHPDACGPCPLKPDLVTHCCCGQTPLTAPRTSCLSPVPTCSKICSKPLRCGQPSNPHICTSPCHPDTCPPCSLSTWVKCRCGNMDREIPCSDLKTKADDARCEKKCTKKRSCGKHKCNQHCCIDIEHVCPLPCSKTLSCGRHKCELTCHKGRCHPCYRSSFEELFCECGTAVVYPPVPCGTRRPTCTRPCSRQHPCGHEVLHNCHSESICPPCTVLTQKWCYGKHELRKAVPCHLNEMSCGLPCGKPISCGRHKCITLCHPGSCEKGGQVCVQPCTTPREMCGHPCAANCHEGKCPDTPCKENVKVTCTCGHRTTTRVCAENSKEYQRIASGILASKMADMQLGHSVDLEEVFGQGAKKQNQLKTLPCNDECALIERNRKLALGLQIVNPDLSGKLMPRYSEHMKAWAKKDPHFCQIIHEKLSELVQLAKTSKHKSRSYSFDSMNRDKRQFVHESCEHFGCKSQAYDQEPKRNVVATAVKDKCWLPSYSLLEMVQRENGQRKVPRPMLNTARTNTLTSRTSEVLPSTAKMSQKLQPTVSSSKSPEPEIDYFDFPNSSLT
ncbi:protein shuttle craft [Fopius arisanus]|uniref:Protein shuttle craft n=1 Tax=Fopius arisanus TaxID=64838 RepID=A0A0C9RKL9_9HYME|nr:PREDICTED: protein shuttle craft [Fopius arisanus]